MDPTSAEGEEIHEHVVLKEKKGKYEWCKSSKFLQKKFVDRNIKEGKWNPYCHFLGQNYFSFGDDNEKNEIFFFKRKIWGLTTFLPFEIRGTLQINQDCIWVIGSSTNEPNAMSFGKLFDNVYFTCTPVNVMH